MMIHQFLRFNREIYFDNNATTKISKTVAGKINFVMKNYYGNPSSIYKMAINSAILLDESRSIVAKTLHAEPSEIIFTSCATEANNMIIKSLAEYHFPRKKKIISTPIEHAAIISTLEYLQTKGFEIQYVSVDNFGFVNETELENLLDEHTCLVCCMLANNETGVIQNVKKIAEIVHSHHIPILADCVQGLGKIPVDVKYLDVDYATFSAHKIHGPKGIGALFVKKSNFIAPLIHGGHQENGMRAGTESVHNIVGFAEACKHLNLYLLKTKKLHDLKHYFIAELKKIKPDIIVNSPSENCLPNTVSIIFPNVNNAILLAVLDYYGISVSAGSACNTQENLPSHVLLAIGLTKEQARETLRFSFSVSTKINEIKYALHVIKDFVTNKFEHIGTIDPKQLDEKLLFDNDTYILDVRFWHDRILIKSLPNANEIPYFTYKKYLKLVPKDKNIIVICQGGVLSPTPAFTMKNMGFKNVSFLMLGMTAWKAANPVLYEKFAGKNVKKLKL